MKNDKVNTLESLTPKMSHKVVVQPDEDSNVIQKQTITHEEESCLDTFSGRWFCGVTYVSVNKTTFHA